MNLLFRLSITIICTLLTFLILGGFLEIVAVFLEGAYSSQSSEQTVSKLIGFFVVFLWWKFSPAIFLHLKDFFKRNGGSSI